METQQSQTLTSDKKIAHTTVFAKLRIALDSLSALGVIVLAVVLFLLVNLVASLFFSSARLDLTEDGLYTISDGAIETVQQIREPMTLRLYASETIENFAGLQSYLARVEGLLTQLASRSSGKLKVQIIRPEPFSPQEDQAVAFGLQAAQISDNQIFFGIAVTNHLDEARVVPFLSPDREPFLEYDLIKAIDELRNQDKPVIGLLSYADFNQEQQGEPVAFRQLDEKFDLVRVERDATDLPPNLSLLVLIHPTIAMSEQLRLAIDQYFINNGKLVLAIDPLFHASEASQSPLSPSSDFGELLSGWGVSFDSNSVTADPLNALSVNMQTAQGLQSIRHLSWLQFGRSNLNQDDVVTSELNQLRFISGGSVALADPSNDAIDFQPLVFTSPSGGTLGSMILQQPNTRLWQSAYQAKGSLPVVARFSGVFTSAFDQSADIRITPDASNLLVIADVDMFVDRYWIEVAQNFLNLTFRTADNGVLLLNAVDNMIGSYNLISLRSRGIRERPFDRVSELRKEANDAFLIRQQQLEEQLQQTEARLSALQSQSNEGNALLLNQAQRAEVQKFQQQRIATRQQLRELQLQLNRDIENLGVIIKLINIALLPLLLLIAAFVFPGRLGVQRR